MGMMGIVFEMCGTHTPFYGISGIWVVRIEGLLTHVSRKEK